MPEHPRRPRDTNQLAKMVVDIASGEVCPDSLGISNESARKGGLIGGKARAEKLAPERRAEIARKAATARYAKAK